MAEQEAQSGPIHLFYSYAHNDESLRNELDKHLILLRRQGYITQWHNRDISAGTDWKHEIDAHLEMADIILLLISADFLASEYCYSGEMRRALERHQAKASRVIPILLRPVDWQGAPFAPLQMLPRDGKPVTIWPNRDLAYEAIAVEIRAVISKLNESRSSPIDVTIINLPEPSSGDNAYQQIAPLKRREDAGKVMVISSELLDALENLRRFQRKVSELKSVHNMLHEIERQLEILTATMQFQLILYGNKEEKGVPKWPFTKKEVNQPLSDIKVIEIVWQEVRQKIDDLRYFATVEMDALEEESFVLVGNIVQGPLWITEIFVLQSSFEASMKQQNVREMNDLSSNLLRMSRSHLYLIDKQLLKAVKELDTASDYILRTIQ